MSLPLAERSPGNGDVRALPQLTRSTAPYSWAWAVVLLVADLLVFCLALTAAAIIGYNHHHLGFPFSRLLIYNAVYVALWVLIFERLGLYRRTAALTVKDELYFTVAALTIGIIPQFLLFTAFPHISTSRFVLLYALGFSIVGAGSVRTILHAMRKKSAMHHRRRVAIVGGASRIEQARASMELPLNSQALLIPVENIDRDYGINLTGDVDMTSIPWLYRALSWECDTIVFADIPPPQLIPHLLETAARRSVRIAFAPPRIQRYSYALTLQVDGHQALIVPERLKACTPRARLAKRMMDVACAALALALFSPIMLLCALGIWLESRGPIFYRQERVGLNGRVFEILKFRSMRTDAEAQVGAVWAKEGDDRCTRVGRIMRRLSFDELPQLLNVMRGDMSLVGPRPERPIFVEAFRAAYPRYDERHLVRPGMSGVSQMQMRRVLSTNDVGQKLTFDLFYIEEWSLFLDISLLIRTAAEFLFQRAA